MRPNSDSNSVSTFAIRIACCGIGLLYLIRGAFQNYISPMFRELSSFSYVQIAWLLTVFGFAQSVCAPFAGWFADRTSIRTALATSVLTGCAAFLLFACSPSFPVSLAAIFVSGLGFILCKISLNTILVLHSSAANLRRSVAMRATLLNLGSFIGNSLAQYTSTLGYSIHAVILGLLYLPLSIGLIAQPSPSVGKTAKSSWLSNIGGFFRNRSFLSDALRRFAVSLPYGCWGTIIPIYVIDQNNGSIERVWIISLTCLVTTIVGAHFLAVYVSQKLYDRGFRWEWWSLASVLFFLIGLFLLSFAKTGYMLPLAISIFVCGEILMTPCFDETAKKHSSDSSMSTCMGLLHLVDGLGRWLGATYALAFYGLLRGTPYVNLYWPIVVVSFFTISGGLHLGCYFVAGDAKQVQK